MVDINANGFNFKNRNILCLVAHPDDEVIGCGASLAKFSQLQAHVRVVLPLKRSDSRGIANWEKLMTNFSESCGVLGCTPIIVSGLLDESQATLQLQTLHGIIKPYVEWADIVLTHWRGDVNPSHRVIARAVEIATRPFRCRKNVAFFEIPTSTDQTSHYSYRPNFYSILNHEHVDKKIKAIRLYETEKASGRTPEHLKIHLQYRGAQINTEYAESFMIGWGFC